MNIRKDLPKEYDPHYILTIEEQTIIIEMSIVTSFLLEQIRMPMVTDFAGDSLVECLQSCLSASILAFIKAGLITEEFFLAYQKKLDEKTGIRKTVKLGAMGVSDMTYDVMRMINRYMVVLGHEDRLIPEKDEIYGNARFFMPRS